MFTGSSAFADDDSEAGVDIVAHLASARLGGLAGHDLISVS
jgi:hypothetical protein